MMYTRKIFLVLMLLVSLVILAACSGNSGGSGNEPPKQPQQTTEEKAKPVEKVSLDFAVTGMASYYAPIFVTLDKGFFEEQGLEVNVVTIGTTENPKALMSGSPPIGIPADDSAMVAFAKGGAITMVGGFLQVAPYDIVSLPKYSKISELKGETIGVSSLTSGSTTLVKKLFEAEGLKEGDYEMIPAGNNAQRAAALESGSVAAAATSDPGTFILLDKGFTHLGSISDSIPQYSFISFWVNNDWAGKNENVVVSFLSAMIKGLRWLNDPANKAEAISIIAKNLKIEEKYAEMAYESHQKLNSWPKDFEVNQEALKVDLEFQSELGVYKDTTIPDIKDFADTSYWQKAVSSLK